MILRWVNIWTARGRFVLFTLIIDDKLFIQVPTTNPISHLIWPWRTTTCRCKWTWKSSEGRKESSVLQVNLNLLSQNVKYEQYKGKPTGFCSRFFTLELTYEKTTKQRGEDNPVLSFYSILFQAFMSSFPGKTELRAID